MSYNIVLIVPDMAALQELAFDNGIDLQNPDWVNQPSIIDFFNQEVKKLTESFKGYEKPRGIILIGDEWTPENGMLTPTQKYKRRVIVKKYEDDIEKAYKKTSKIF